MNFIGDDLSGACFSPCRVWRYTLWRRWEECDLSRMCVFVCLNPSTADETKNDPTVTRCINFSKAWGFSGFVMLNLFGFRATDPKEMKAAADPVGPENDSAIEAVCRQAGRVVFAWGTDGLHQSRCHHVTDLLDSIGVKPMYLVKTLTHQPGHPLYVRADTVPKPWE